MLGRKNKAETAVATPNATGTSTIIPNCHISGTFKSEGNIRLEGSVEGKIICKGKVVIGESGKVEGDIECVDADISGTIIGNISASGIVNINKGGNVNGDITAENIKMDLGAKFIGRSLMKTQPSQIKVPQIETKNPEKVG